jgi:uncharacterized phage-associated protein
MRLKTITMTSAAKGNDPRAIANLLLDLADEVGLAIGHVKLQKLLYFAHGMHLIETGEPLVSGNFEAWQYGPVHPAVYRAFKGAGSKRIEFRGEREDVLSGLVEVVPASTDQSAQQALRRVLMTLGKMRDFDLVELSHAPGAPWRLVVDEMEGGLALGARIGDDTIRANFARHKIAVRTGAASAGSTTATLREAADVVEKPFTSTDRARKSLS